MLKNRANDEMTLYFKKRQILEMVDDLFRL
jgi:hypothetical protein